MLTTLYKDHQPSKTWHLDMCTQNVQLRTVHEVISWQINIDYNVNICHYVCWWHAT